MITEKKSSLKKGKKTPVKLKKTNVERNTQKLSTGKTVGRNASPKTPIISGGMRTTIIILLVFLTPLMVLGWFQFGGNNEFTESSPTVIKIKNSSVSPSKSSPVSISEDKETAEFQESWNEAVESADAAIDSSLGFDDAIEKFQKIATESESLKRIEAAKVEIANLRSAKRVAALKIIAGLKKRAITHIDSGKYDMALQEFTCYEGPLTEETKAERGKTANGLKSKINDIESVRKGRTLGVSAISMVADGDLRKALDELKEAPKKYGLDKLETTLEAFKKIDHDISKNLQKKIGLPFSLPTANGHASWKLVGVKKDRLSIALKMKDGVLKKKIKIEQLPFTEREKCLDGVPVLVKNLYILAEYLKIGKKEDQAKKKIVELLHSLLPTKDSIVIGMKELLASSDEVQIIQGVRKALKSPLESSEERERVGLDSVDENWFSENRLGLDAPPRPAGFDFSKVELAVKNHIKKLPAELRKKEMTRYGTVSSLREHVATLLGKANYEGQILELDDGRKLRGKIMGNINGLSVIDRDTGRIKKVKWEEISQDQFFKFMQYYIDERLGIQAAGGAGDAKKDEILKSAACECVYLAVLADWYGRPKKTIEYVHKAMKIEPSSKELVDELVLGFLTHTPNKTDEANGNHKNL